MSSATFLIGTNRPTESTTLTVRQPERRARVRSVGPEQFGVDAFGHRMHRAAQQRRQIRGGPAVCHQRIRLLDIGGVSRVRRAGKIDHHRDVAAPQPRRLIQRMRMHDVRSRLGRAAIRCHAARQNHSSSRCSAFIVIRPKPRVCCHR